MLKSRSIVNKIIGLVLVLTFVLMAFITGISIFATQKSLYNQLHTQAEEIAQQVKQQIQMEGQVGNDVDKMLEDNLYEVGYSVGYMNGYSSGLLENLSKTSGISEINIVDNTGHILFSNLHDNIGYIYKPDSAIQDILHGKKDKLAEPERKSTVDNKYYKYAYVKVPGKGTVIQVGLSADYIQSVKKNIQVQQTIQNIVSDKNIVYIYIVDKDKIITAHSNKAKIGKKADNAQISNVIKNKAIFTDTTFNTDINQKIYETILPLYDKNGALSCAVDIGLSTKPIEDAINRIIFQTGLVSLMIFILIGAGMYSLIKRFLNPISILVNASENMSNGDLTAEISVTSKDEFENLSSAFNTMVSNIKRIISNIKSAIDQLFSFSSELLSSSQQTTSIAQQIASATDDVAKGAVDQVDMATKIQENAGSMSANVADLLSGISEFKTSTNQMTAITNESQEDMTDMSNQINFIKESSLLSNSTIKDLIEAFDKIGATINIINEIANQTNLLSLNATIEAARAGEQGQGFAVVAEEVKKLAEDSANSAKNISTLIMETQAKSKDTMTAIESSVAQALKGQEIVEKVNQSFNNIINTIKVTDSLAHNLEETSLEVKCKSESVSATINKIAGISQNAAANAEEVAASTEKQVASFEHVATAIEKLNSITADLEMMIQKFKI